MFNVDFSSRSSKPWFIKVDEVMISAFKGKTIHIILTDCGEKGPGGVEWVLRKSI